MRRVAAIDIGSNSVRLVIYGVVGSALVSLFDEKATCGLGRNLGTSGVLDPEGRARALQELKRFGALAASSALEALYPFATAAVRDAEDGELFVEEIARKTGLRVDVLSGLDEARFSAMGVAGAIPGATGIVGDLGGGSLELVRLENGEVRDHDTLPIGSLLRPTDGSRGETSKWLDERLCRVKWLTDDKPGDFYLVGGAWRAFARAHMRHSDYPLSVIHQYAMVTGDARELADLIAVMSDRSLSLLNSVSRRRRAMMPYASQVLSRLIACARPQAVIASAHGLREGFVRHRLGLGGSDPFLDYCRFAGPATARMKPDGDAINRWLAPLFADATPETRRRVEAASWLADLAGRDHPDRRADIALARGMNVPSVALSHEGRAFLGCALRARYGGKLNGSAGPAQHLLTPTQLQDAERLGAALRLAHAISPSGHGLRDVNLRLTADSVELNGSQDLLSGDTIARRLRGVAAAFGRAPLLQPNTKAA
ncbi:MAG TPA: Ppx/GppA family phosphatase [Alphaproteobacteria bacterium]|nr:Ppx/GppA family phosphatase [Alphaproteobacteria bacterium]